MQVLKLGMSVIYKRKSFEIPAFWGHYALSRWTLFRGEDSPPPVPDRGATEMFARHRPWCAWYGTAFP